MSNKHRCDTSGKFVKRTGRADRLNDEGNYKCIDCLEFKTPDNFSPSKKGPHSYCRTCANIRATKSYARRTSCKLYKVRLAEQRRKYDLRAIYRLSLEDFDNLLIRQDYKCAICQESFIKTARIDHCHTYGNVRGLLCDLCNRGLGFFKDNTETLTKAILYLNAFRKEDNGL